MDHAELADPGILLVEGWVYVCLDDVLVAVDPTNPRHSAVVACLEWPYPKVQLANKLADHILDAFWKHRPESDTEEDVLDRFLAGEDIPEEAYPELGLSAPTRGSLYRLVIFEDDARGCFIALGPDRDGVVSKTQYRSPYVILKYEALDEAPPEQAEALDTVIDAYQRYQEVPLTPTGLRKILDQHHPLVGDTRVLKQRYGLSPSKADLRKDLLFYQITGPQGPGLFLVAGPNREHRRPGSADRLALLYWHLTPKRLRKIQARQQQETMQRVAKAPIPEGILESLLGSPSPGEVEEEPPPTLPGTVDLDRLL